MDRIVSIHSQIQNLVKKRYDKAVVNGTPYLFTYPRKDITKKTYTERESKRLREEIEKIK